MLVPYWLLFFLSSTEVLLLVCWGSPNLCFRRYSSFPNYLVVSLLAFLVLFLFPSASRVVLSHLLPSAGCFAVLDVDSGVVVLCWLVLFGLLLVLLLVVLLMLHFRSLCRGNFCSRGAFSDQACLFRL